MFHILKDKKPVPTSDYSQFQDSDARRVAWTEQDGVEVSTVFLSIDHGYTPDKPLWFETMVFGGEFDNECDRYETYAEAEDGHQVMYARVIWGSYRHRGYRFGKSKRGLKKALKLCGIKKVTKAMLSQ